MNILHTTHTYNNLILICIQQCNTTCTTIIYLYLCNSSIHLLQFSLSLIIIICPFSFTKISNSTVVSAHLRSVFTRHCRSPRPCPVHGRGARRAGRRGQACQRRARRRARRPSAWPRRTYPARRAGRGRDWARGSRP